MAYANHKVNALISLDPDQARRIIVDTLTNTKFHMADAAKSMGCDYVTLLRWIKRLDLGELVAEKRQQAKKDGSFHGRGGGRPPGIEDCDSSKYEEKRNDILEAMKHSRMHTARAAQALGLSLSGFQYWIRRLKLTPILKKLRKVAKKEGWHYVQETPRLLDEGRYFARKTKIPRPKGKPGRPARRVTPG